jgi:signal transduction histidine kinase
MDSGRFQHIARELGQTADREEAAECALQGILRTFGYPIGGVYFYDRRDQMLGLDVTHSDQFSATEVLPECVTPDAGAVWECYRSDSPDEIETTSSTLELMSPTGVQFTNVIVYPVGKFGVILAAADESTDLESQELQNAELITEVLLMNLYRLEWEYRLEKAQQVTARLINASSRDDVFSILADELEKTFGLPLFAIWEHDRQQDRLIHAASSQMVYDVFETIPTFTPGDSIAWQVFESQEPELVPDIDEESQRYNDTTPIGSEMVVPIGEHGVMIAGSTLKYDFTEADLKLFQTLATTAASVIGAVETRQDLELLHRVLGRILRHNLRNGVTVIHGHAERISRADSVDEAVEYATKILDRTDDLRSTAEHAGEMREAIKSRREYVTHELSDVITEAWLVIRNRYPDASIDVDLQDSAEFRGHPDLNRAIRHLIENGIEHTDETAPTVEVTAWTTDSCVVIEVSDNGPGLPEAELEPVREGVETVLKHGSGAGLWIVDRIVDYSDGEIEYDIDDTGTTARITL